MKIRASHYFFMIPLAILVLSQVMCNMPMKEEESIQLAEELLGLEVSEDFVYEVEVEVEQENECPEYVPPQAQIESYKFWEKNGTKMLTVITPNGELLYQYRVTYGYCRFQSDTNIPECIRFDEAGNYTFEAFYPPNQDDTKNGICYRATHTLLPTGQAMPGNQVAEELEGNESLGQSEAQSEDVPPLAPPDTGPQPVPTVEQVFETASPQECNASNSLSIQASQPEREDTSYETRCKYTLSFTNTGAQPIWVFLFKQSEFMTGEKNEYWENYLNLAPGESEELTYRITTRKSDGAIDMNFLGKVAPIFATTACKNTFKNNEPVKEQIAYPVEDPCR